MPKCCYGKCTFVPKKGDKTYRGGKTGRKVLPSPYKATKDGGVRLSASFYFNVKCDGKITRCRPQWIRQSDGEYKMKRIKICSGKNGPEPRWVNC